MIIINMKKIKIFLSCLLFCILFLSAQILGQISFQKNISAEKNSLEVVATPVSKKTVVLDAGHGIPDEGAESSNGTTEASLNLKIALKVQNLLELSGATVVLTRSDENAIYDLDASTLKEKKISDIHNRVKFGNESSADIFVSIHLNKIPQEQYWGWQTFYRENNTEGKKLATCIQNSLNETIHKENTRVPLKIDNIYIIKHVEIPTTIVECGFLSNVEEEQLLQTDEYQDKLAWGIYLGIMDYFLE